MAEAEQQKIDEELENIKRLLDNKQFIPQFVLILVFVNVIYLCVEKIIFLFDIIYQLYHCISGYSIKNYRSERVSYLRVIFHRIPLVAGI